MLDPATAVGVASAVVQFVDFGVTLFKSTQEISKSLVGMTSETGEIEHVVNNLQEHIQRLQECRDIPKTSSLVKLLNDCIALANEILEKTQKHKKGNQKFLANLRPGFFTLWDKKDVNEMQLRMDRLQDALNSHLTVDTK